MGRVREDGELDTSIGRVADDFGDAIREAQDAAFDDSESRDALGEAAVMEEDE